MNKNVIRVAAAIPGIPMLINGIGFIATPLETAQSLGMELLTGIGLSTQLGDFARHIAAQHAGLLSSICRYASATLHQEPSV